MAATQWQEVGGPAFSWAKGSRRCQQEWLKESDSESIIEMYELLSELLADHKGEGARQKLSSVRGRKQVQESWCGLQCFAVIVGVVARFEPGVVPRLMAYMVSIIRASQEYEGAAWVAYMQHNRRQAAATGGGGS